MDRRVVVLWKAVLASLVIAILSAPIAWAASGDLDPTFGDGGRVTTVFQNILHDSRGEAVALQPDGKIVVAGFSYSSCCRVFAIARYEPDGSPDPSFGGGDGKTRTQFVINGQQRHAEANAVVIQPDGKIVVAGETDAGIGNGRFALARYDSDGTLDGSFGDGGTATTVFAGSAAGATGLALVDEDKILVGGFAGDEFAYARYEPDGDRDLTFRGDGRARTAFATRSGAETLVGQSDGRFILAGFVCRPECLGGRFAVARYKSSGALDPSFSGDGKVITSFSTGGLALDIALQPDGRIVAGGAVGGRFALVRYTVAGALDDTFSGDGKLTSDFPDAGSANGVAIDEAGNIVVAGGHAGEGFALARYTSAGQLDVSFGAGGLVTTEFAGNSGGAADVLIQPDGAILAAGVGDTQTPDGLALAFALARYLP